MAIRRHLNSCAMIKCGSEDKLMDVTIEAVYEAGVFKPLTPIENLKEHEKVRLVVQSVSLIDAQRQNRIQIDPAAAREIGDSPEYNLLEG
jgi:predicted DNA-binding antitoxin AbrB/MazE fold protein